MFGLGCENEHIVAQQRFNTFDKLLQQCYMAENSLKKIRVEKEKVRQGHKAHGRVGHQLNPKSSLSKGSQPQRLETRNPLSLMSARTLIFESVEAVMEVLPM